MRRHFLAGLLVAVPLGATALILKWMFNTMDNILQPFIRLVWGRSFAGLGIALTIVLIYLLGIMASNVGGKRIIHFGESLVGKVPMIRELYSSIQQILKSFSRSGQTAFLQTVLMEFPRKGMWTLGFITREFCTESGEKRLNIFVPTAPNPMSGFLEITSEEEVIRTDIPVNEALKMIVSAGKVSPPELSRRLSKILSDPAHSESKITPGGNGI
ncbi:MAG: DUF502 domain-containing protein [Dehalococcoidia bacterium]|nr:DUF502 domain-containing protein [Dehalococcoidia bacterium]